MNLLITIRNFLFRWKYVGSVIWTVDYGIGYAVASVYLNRWTNTAHLFYG